MSEFNRWTVGMGPHLFKGRISKIFVGVGVGVMSMSAGLSTFRGDSKTDGTKEGEESDSNRRVVWDSRNEFVPSNMTLQKFLGAPLQFRTNGDVNCATVDTSNFPPNLPFPGIAFNRMDEEADAVFYKHPRIHIHHIDDECIVRLRNWYSDFILRHFKHLPNKVHVDLASSWVSHVPRDYLPSERYIGIGMNMQELNANQKLNERYVIDLNKQPDALQTQLALADDSVDFVHMDLSIDYMTSPVPLLASVYRALNPHHGVLVTSFSNRMFHTKAVRMWFLGDCKHRQKIVAAYLHFAGFDRIDIHEVPPVSNQGIDPLNIVVGFKRNLDNQDIDEV